VVLVSPDVAKEDSTRWDLQSHIGLPGCFNYGLGINRERECPTKPYVYVLLLLDTGGKWYLRNKLQPCTAHLIICIQTTAR